MKGMYAAIKTANENFITTTGAMSEETARNYFTESVNTRVYPVDIQFYDAFPDFLLLENDWSAMKPLKVKKVIALAAKYAEIECEQHEDELKRLKEEYEKMWDEIE